MKRELDDLITEIRAVESSLLILSGEFEGDSSPAVDRGTVHMMLFAVMQQLDRIAEDLDKINVEQWGRRS